jgi:hypothetical protein
MSLQRLCLFFTLVAAGCNERDQQRDTSLSGDILYFDYRIWSEEGKNTVTCLTQFRSGGPNGPAVVLKEPARVSMDNEVLHFDSAALSGAYYEISKPVHDFSGRHTINFTDGNGKEHREEFEFIPFRLASALPEKIQNEPFSVHLDPFPRRETVVHLSLTDTAFMSNDVNELVEVKDAELKISQKMLDRLAPGPIIMELFREEEKSRHHGTKERGRIWISYGLRREFELLK